MSRKERSTRRDLLKRALVVMGAAVLVQPHGGVALADKAIGDKQQDSSKASPNSKLKVQSKTNKSSPAAKSADKATPKLTR